MDYVWYSPEQDKIRIARPFFSVDVDYHEYFIEDGIAWWNMGEFN